MRKEDRAMEDLFLCGAGKASITPPVDMLKDLRGLRDIRFSAVLDDIFVRALALRIGERTALIVVFELDKVPCPREFLDELTAETDIDEEYITLLATHIHTAPIGGYRPNEVPNFIENKPQNVQKATRAYENLLRQAMLKAAKAALSGITPAEMFCGSGESFININRVQSYHVRCEDGRTETRCGLGQDPTAPVNRRLFIMSIRTPEGRPVAFLSNYAVHNCVMIENRCTEDGGTLLGSDLGGQISKYLERDYPGSVALWTSGAAGDVNPVMCNEIFYPDPVSGAQTALVLPPKDKTPIMMLQVLAARHYEDVKRVLCRSERQAPPEDIFGAVKWVETPGRCKGQNGEWETGGETPPYRVRVHLLKLGRLFMAGFSGELLGSCGEALFRIMPEQSILFNHEASLLAESGYIFDDETWYRDEGEALPGHAASLQMPGYIGPALQETLSRMCGTAEQTK